MATSIALCCLRAVAILKYLLCLSVGFSCLFIVWTNRSWIFFSTNNLQQQQELEPLDCSVTWSLLTRTDEDWTCWLAADSQVRKHKHKFETDSDSGHNCTLPTNSTLLAAAADASTFAEQLPPLLTSYDDAMHKNCYLWDFQATAQSEQQWHSDANCWTWNALFVTNSKLSTNAYLVWICPENGRYVLFFITTSETSTSSRCVIVQGLPERTQV